MMFAIDDGTAAVIVALITGAVAMLGILLDQTRKVRREVSAVNRAVNQVQPGELTLIERVKKLERRSDTQMRWLGDVLSLLAAQLGVDLPSPPEEDKAA